MKFNKIFKLYNLTIIYIMKLLKKLILCFERFFYKNLEKFDNLTFISCLNLINISYFNEV